MLSEMRRKLTPSPSHSGMSVVPRGPRSVQPFVAAACFCIALTLAACTNGSDGDQPVDPSPPQQTSGKASTLADLTPPGASYTLRHALDRPVTDGLMVVRVEGDSDVTIKQVRVRSQSDVRTRILWTGIRRVPDDTASALSASLGVRAGRLSRSMRTGYISTDDAVLQGGRTYAIALTIARQSHGTPWALRGVTVRYASTGGTSTTITDAQDVQIH
jgi:hypothetical protein